MLSSFICLYTPRGKTGGLVRQIMQFFCEYSKCKKKKLKSESNQNAKTAALMYSLINSLFTETFICGHCCLQMILVNTLFIRGNSYQINCKYAFSNSYGIKVTVFSLLIVKAKASPMYQLII